MKRSIVCLLLALCLCLGLAACGAKPSQDDANNNPAVSDNTEPQLSGKVTVYMPSPLVWPTSWLRLSRQRPASR